MITGTAVVTGTSALVLHNVISIWAHFFNAYFKYTSAGHNMEPSVIRGLGTGSQSPFLLFLSITHDRK